MGFLKSISARLGITVFLLLLQVAAIITAVVLVLVHFPIVSYFAFVISILVFLYIVREDGASGYKMVWITIVLLLPAIGGILYLFYGKIHQGRRLMVKHIEEHAIIAKLLDNDGNISFMKEMKSKRMFSLFKYIRHVTSYHAYDKTASKYYSFGEFMFEDMLLELEAAEKFIFFEYFIVKKSGMWDRLLDVLERKAAQGVEVRLIVDDFGSQKLFTNKYIKHLGEKNIKVLRFNPIIPVLYAFMNHRDHRKILVVDGKTAFVGGLNIADEYINENDRLGIWKDNGLRLQGEGVFSFTLMFIEMWDTFSKPEERINNHLSYQVENLQETLTEQDGLVLPYGDSPLDNYQIGEDIYIDILNQAENYVTIFTPYLIISEKMIHALQTAAGRGVDVRIVTPGIPDKRLIFRLTRSYYKCLQEAGVRIFEYTPGFLHAKTFLCDDNVAVVGTINLDYRSLYLHFECACLLYHSSTIEAIKADAVETIGQCKEMLLSDKRKHVSWKDLIDAVLHLFAPLL